jgi:hypothetical protein
MATPGQGGCSRREAHALIGFLVCSSHVQGVPPPTPTDTSWPLSREQVHSIDMEVAEGQRGSAAPGPHEAASDGEGEGRGDGEGEEGRVSRSARSSMSWEMLSENTEEGAGSRAGSPNSFLLTAAAAAGEGHSTLGGDDVLGAGLLSDNDGSTGTDELLLRGEPCMGGAAAHAVGGAGDPKGDVPSAEGGEVGGEGGEGLDGSAPSYSAAAAAAVGASPGDRLYARLTAGLRELAVRVGAFALRAGSEGREVAGAVWSAVVDVYSSLQVGVGRRVGGGRESGCWCAFGFFRVTL